MRPTEMKTTKEYIELVRLHLIRRDMASISDYRIAKELGLNHSCVSRYVNSRGSMDDKTAVLVAKFLEIPEIEVIAATNAEKTRDEESRKFWEKLFAEKRSLPTEQQGKNSPAIRVGRNGSERVLVDSGSNKDYRK